MPVFHFQLEPLLRVRCQRERERQRDVAVLENRRRELEEALRRQQRLVLSGKHDLRESLSGLLDMTALRDEAATTVHALRAAQRLVLELAGIHRKIESARAKLIESSRERRAIELLRERRLADWRRRIGRAEDAAIDELAVQAAARKE